MAEGGITNQMVTQLMRDHTIVWKSREEKLHSALRSIPVMATSLGAPEAVEYAQKEMEEYVKLYFS